MLRIGAGFLLSLLIFFFRMWDSSIQSIFATTAGNSAGMVVITVQITNDSGPGSLRNAISLAAAGDTIDFAPAVLSAGAITLTSGEIIIDKDLIIQGPGSDLLTVQRQDGTPDFRIFSIINGARVDISGLTITNGSAIDDTGTTPEKDDGGGIQVRNAELTLTGCEIYNNFAKGDGGGIDVYAGTLTVYESTISYNNAGTTGLGATGGGIFVNSGTTLTITSSTISYNNADNSAAIEIEDSAATLINSTISGNASLTGGGAINNAAAPSQASSLTLTNCTVAYNTEHGVLTVENGGGSSQTTLKNTIFERNWAQNFRRIGAGAVLVSLGNNFDSDGTSGFTDGVNGDIVGNIGSPIYAILGPLTDNGGPTWTHALLHGSPAIDAGDDSAAPGIDQRDHARTGPEADGDGDGTSASDIGAFEVRKHLVTTTADSGAGSLRQAITDNNASGGGLIAFDIPGGGVHTIAPSLALPVITRTVTIDGYTQPGSRPNGLLTLDDAILLIELSGANAGSAEGFELQASYCTVRGLVINGFDNGIMIRGPNGFHNEILGNFIGCDPTGLSPVPNRFSGVNILEGAFSNVIGDQDIADRNLIGGNAGAGIIVQSVNTVRNFVLGNFIGLAADGASNLGNTAGTQNSGFGVIIGFGARETFVSNNVIAFNDDSGIVIATDNSAPAPVNNPLTVNAIFSNEGLGIDLGDDLVTANDSGDADSGPNNLQNFPVIDSVTATGISGSLNSTPNSIFRIEFYANAVCDPSGHGQGEYFLGALDFGNAVLTDGSGNANFAFSFTPIAGKPYITATATNNVTNDTSEFSACFLSVSMPTLTLVKTVVNNNGGTLTANDFQGFIDSSPVSWGVAVTLSAGTHTASETTQAGYAASVWGGDCAADGSITLTPGDNKTCTITNDDVAVTLSQVSIFDDLIIATGAGFVAPVQVFIDGVGFQTPAIVESDGSGVRQAGILSNGKTIAETVVPGKTLQIEIFNSGGGRVTYSYTQSRSISSRNLQRRPPIVLTNVYFSGTSVTIEGSLSGLIPNTEYVVYFFYTPSGDLPSTAKTCPDSKDPQTIMLSPPITVKTDNFGNSNLFRQVYPAVLGKGFVNAIAVPAIGTPIKLTSNCIGATEPPGPTLFELKVELDRQDPGKDRLVILGFGFSDPKVFLNDIEFVDRAGVAETPTFGQQLIQSGRLRDGRSIRDVIKPGETVRIMIRNGTGGVTLTQFRN